MNTCKITQIERTGKQIYFTYNVLNDRKCEDSNDGFSLQVRLAFLGGSQQEDLSEG